MNTDTKRNHSEQQKKLECYEDIEKHIFFDGNGCGDYYCYNINQDGIVDISAIYIWLAVLSAMATAEGLYIRKSV